MPVPFSILPLCEYALSIEVGKNMAPAIHQQVVSLARQLSEHPFEGLLDVVPAYTTVTVYFDPLKVAAQDIANNFFSPTDWIQNYLLTQLSNPLPYNNTIPPVIEIPVCYGGEYGPDLEWVAGYTQLTVEKVIELHSSTLYTVYQIGFAPGFPYLGGMPSQLACPRKDNPRLAVPPGSVGIAGIQTGIYPIKTPGGWQLIGRTPLQLFRPEDPQPSLLKVGDRVRFLPIDAATF